MLASFLTGATSARMTSSTWKITVMSKLYENDNCESQFHIYYNASKQAEERELKVQGKLI